MSTSMMEFAMVFAHFVQALPGYFVLDIVADNAGYPAAVHRDAVVAWAFEEGDELAIPYPVTMTGVQTDSPAVLDPWGGVAKAGAGCALTVESWLLDEQENYRSRRQGA